MFCVIMACVDLCRTGGHPPRSFPSCSLLTIFNGLGTNGLSGKDWPVDGTRGRGTGSTFCALVVLLGAGIDVGLGMPRRATAFGTTVGKDPGRDARGTDERSWVDIGGGIDGGSFAGAYRFVEMLLTTNGLVLTIVYSPE